jgi:Right handed beta helix region
MDRETAQDLIRRLGCFLITVAAIPVMAIALYKFIQLLRCFLGENRRPRHPFRGDLPQNAQRLFVSPDGNDASQGTQSSPFRTLMHAWNVAAQTTDRLCLITLLGGRGNYDPMNQDRVGIDYIILEGQRRTASAPIVIQGQRREGGFLRLGLSLASSSYIYLVDLSVENQPGGNGEGVQIQECDNVLIRNCYIDGASRLGPFGRDSEGRCMRELAVTVCRDGLKVNQSTNIFIEDCEIRGGENNCIDFVAVQNGHIVGNHLHDVGAWGLWVKGGSAYLHIEGNRIYNCVTGGFSAGQGSGLQFMTRPFLHYEAYAIRFVNNIVHDIVGSGLGVQGGYNILLAYNTLYRVGCRSHAIQVGFGERTCDAPGAASDPSVSNEEREQAIDRTRDLCATRLTAGGWGTSCMYYTDINGVENPEQCSDFEPIPSRHVYIYNNLIYNPSDYSSPDGQFSISAEADPGPSSSSNIPTPTRVDGDLQIRGNLIWNGPADMRMGRPEIPDFESSPHGGCNGGTCSPSDLRMYNSINTAGFEPILRNPSGNDFHLRPDFWARLIFDRRYRELVRRLIVDLPPFDWSDVPPLRDDTRANPPEELRNVVVRDYDGTCRLFHLPGAFAA